MDKDMEGDMDADINMVKDIDMDIFEITFFIGYKIAPKLG
jgi:hypothetical protein